MGHRLTAGQRFLVSSIQVRILVPQGTPRSSTVTLKLTARRRVGTGKGAGRRIRSGGLIPAVMYGDTSEPVNLAVNPKAVRDLLLSPSGRNTLFSVEVDGGETVALARFAGYQQDPVRRTLLHCDIQRLNPEQERTFKVPIQLQGTSAAEKAGGRVRFVTRMVKLMCRPQDCPATLEVDVSEVGLGQTIRLGDVNPPANSKLLFSDNAPVVVASAGVIVDEDETEESGEEAAAETEDSSEG